MPPTESNVNVITARLHAPILNFPVNPRPAKRLKTLDDVQESSQTGSSVELNETGYNLGAIPAQVEPEPRSKARKNSRPVKNVQETEYGPEIIKPKTDDVMIKSETCEPDNQTDSMNYAGYGVNWMSDVHKIGSATYLSKPAQEQGMYY